VGTLYAMRVRFESMQPAGQVSLGSCAQRPPNAFPD
jgi:hypothetical protein